MYQIGAARMSCTLRFPADYKGFNVTSDPERRKYPPQVLAFAVRRRWRHPEPAWAVPRRFPNHSPRINFFSRRGARVAIKHS